MKQSNIIGRIRDLRESSDLTQTEVSQKLNIQRATYSNYENGVRTPPIEVLIALAKLYEVSIDYIVCGTEPVITKSLNGKEKKLLKGYAQLTSGDQDEILNYIEFKKAYPRLP